MHDMRSREQPPASPCVKVTEWTSRQIVDQNTTPSRFCHAVQQLLRVIVTQMVNKQRRHQHVVVVWQRLDERVELEKLRAKQPRSLGEVLCNFNCCRTDVAAMCLDGNAIPGGKLRNADHHIATTCGNIENSQRPVVIPDNACFPDPAPKHLRSAT